MILNLFLDGPEGCAEYIARRIRGDAKWIRGSKTECYVGTTGRIHLRDTHRKFKATLPEQWFVAIYNQKVTQEMILFDLRDRMQQLGDCHP